MDRVRLRDTIARPRSWAKSLSRGAAPALATATETCAPREIVVEQLARRYGETRQSMGLGPRNTLMELFASRETGSWTITITTAQGQTCLVASGQAFETLAETSPTRGEDA